LAVCDYFFPITSELGSTEEALSETHDSSLLDLHSIPCVDVQEILLAVYAALLSSKSYSLYFISCQLCSLFFFTRLCKHVSLLLLADLKSRLERLFRKDGAKPITKNDTNAILFELSVCRAHLHTLLQHETALTGACSRESLIECIVRVLSIDPSSVTGEGDHSIIIESVASVFLELIDRSI
jgi:hypothetical protein